jgi:2-phosphosulfolactate phosphatase
MYNSQLKYKIKFDWGLNGLYNLTENSDVIVIVDILSFSTCVDIALENGGIIFPFDEINGNINDYASAHSALIAEKNRNTDSISLSPHSMSRIKQGQKVVLPSPNGSVLSLRCDCDKVICGCLRNAGSVSAYLNSENSGIGVVAAGEKWNDGSLRPCVEDYLGAGSIISKLAGTKSPEAMLAELTYRNIREPVIDIIKSSCSGFELIERGFEYDVELACHENISGMVPLLIEKKYYKNNCRQPSGPFVIS